MRYITLLMLISFACAEESESLKVKIEGIENLSKSELVEMCNKLMAEKILIERRSDKVIKALKEENSELRAQLIQAREELDKVPLDKSGVGGK